MTKDQFIVKALGECWHVPIETSWGEPPWKCRKCGAFFIYTEEPNPILDTPEGFFWLWERFQKQERWEEFLDWFFIKELKEGNMPVYPQFHLLHKLINRINFPNLVAEFFGWKEDSK